MTLRSEVIALLDGVTALGQRVYADEAPEGTTLPYVTVLVDIARTPTMIGDGKTSWWAWLGQVDLWERRADEDAAVINAVLDALDGKKIASGLRLRVRSAPRIQDPDFEITHTAITVTTPVPR